MALLSLGEQMDGFHIGDGAGYRYPPVNGYNGGYYMGESMDIKMDPEVLDMYHSHHANQTPSPMGTYPSTHEYDYPGLGGPGRGRKNKEDKICGVCGDRALGYNFDAISCESCKAFFRRNAPKGLEYFKCPYDEKCKMDISNRRFCKRCRLKKCFEIGMRKEYILTDEEKAVKRQKIEQNRFNKIVSKGDVTENVLSELERQGLWNGETTTPTVPLCAEDTELIDELNRSYSSSLEITVEKELPRDSCSNFADLVNIAEVSVRRVIAMAKQVKAFKSLPQIDQISLLKGGSIELLILRSVITFDKEKQHFLDPMDSENVSAMNMNQFSAAMNGDGLFDDHMKFVKSLAIDLKADQNTLILLLMISLFSPDRQGLINKELVSEEQERYSDLLLRYLESRYPTSIARAVYPKLLMKLTDIRNLNEEHSQVLLKVNPEVLQPLMQEVLDMKSPGAAQHNTDTPPIPATSGGAATPPTDSERMRTSEDEASPPPPVTSHGVHSPPQMGAHSPSSQIAAQSHSPHHTQQPSPPHAVHRL